jgi:hypothetical protein
VRSLSPSGHLIHDVSGQLLTVDVLAPFGIEPTEVPLAPARLFGCEASALRPD